MKKILVLLFCIFCSPMALSKEDPTPPKQQYGAHLKTLNISASSIYSYEAAMNRFHYMKPDGYVIESIRYVRRGKEYVVCVTLRKI